MFSLGWLGIHDVTDTDFKLILRSVWNTQIAGMCYHTWFITFFFKNAIVYRNVWASYFAYHLHVKKHSWFCVLTFACDPFLAFLSVSMAVALELSKHLQDHAIYTQIILVLCSEMDVFNSFYLNCLNINLMLDRSSEGRHHNVFDASNLAIEAVDSPQRIFIVLRHILAISNLLQVFNKSRAFHIAICFMFLLRWSYDSYFLNYCFYYFWGCNIITSLPLLFLSLKTYFLSFILQMWCIISINWHALKHPRIPMINITCHGYGPCNSLLNLVLSILRWSSHLCLSEIFSSIIFLRASSSGFGIWVMLALCSGLRCASHYDLEMVVQFHVLQMCSTVWWSMVVETLRVGYTGSS